MDIKEQIHVLSEEMIENLGKLVAVDSQLGTPKEGKPFGEGPAEVLRDRKSTRLNSSHIEESRMPSSA